MGGKNLAGLAALGALGMMMNKGKKSPDVDTSGVSDMDLTGGAKSMTPDTGELRDETGALSKLRRNTETGDLYSPNEPITRPGAPKLRSSPRGPNPLLESKADPESTRKVLSGLGYSVDEAGRPYRPGMKKGGVVKMAKGGMTSSASKRADGIAQKGKTKGTMVMCGGGYAKGKK